MNRKIENAKIVNIDFPEGFLKKYLEYGFGNMPKREIDVLIFSYLLKKKEYQKNNYELCKTLQITPTRLKSLLMEVGFKI